MKKRVLSLLLAAIMLFGFVPQGAFAQNEADLGYAVPDGLYSEPVDEVPETPLDEIEVEPTEQPEIEPVEEPIEEPAEEMGEENEEAADETVRLLSEEDAESIGTVRVIIENNTLPMSAGAPWEGVLADVQVELYAESTMMSCIVAALGSYPQEGADSGYITSIAGLTASGTSGWMGTLNDWFTNEGFAAFTAADGTLQSGDEIRIMYSCSFGEDCGGSWSNNDKTLSALTFSTGTLTPEFDGGTHEYTLTVAAGTTAVYVTPTAANKNFQVHTFVGETAYKRAQPIPVADGTVIEVIDGDPSWPTMNGGSYGTADSVPAEVYSVTVQYENTETTVDVTIRSQTAEAYLHGFDSPVTVSSLEAENYGYTDSVEGVSALDALVKAHELVFGEEFTPETASAFLAAGSTGFVTTIFGVETYANGFFINGGYPNDGTESAYGGGYNGTTVTTQQIYTGDVIDFFLYGDDSFYSDYYTYVTVPQEIYAGREFTAAVSGTMAMAGYMYADAAALAAAAEPIEYASLAWVDALTGAVDAISGVSSDESGNAVITAPAEGTYLLAALGNAEEEVYCIMNPTAVTVKNGALFNGDVVIRTSNSTADLSNAILAGENEQGITVFDPAVYEYPLGDILTDANSQLRFYFDLASADLTAKLSWLDAAGSEKSKDITKPSARFANCLHAGQNTLTLTIGDGNGVRDVYTFRVGCVPTLVSLNIRTGGTELYTDGQFAPDIFDYVLTVPESAEKILVDALPKSGDYTVLINGDSSAEISSAGDRIEITLLCADGTKSIYTLNIKRVARLDLIVVPSPADAVVRVYDPKGVEIKQNDDGTYSGMFGEYDYTYTVVKYGYITETGVVPAQGGKLDVVLQAAPETDIEDVGADWGNFRGSDDNMGITDTELPTSGEDAELIWAKKLGSGWRDAPSVQIIVDDSLVVMSGKKLYKLDLAGGEIIAEGDMVSEPSYGYTPPTYAEGMIFCPLGGGTVQAFNAATLESLWVYKDVLGGQALSPITYSDGYIYTGFWNNYTDAASYVCLSITDEDPADPLEVKQASWRFVNNGGYYWAGSLTIGGAVIFGSEDGDKGSGGNAHLYSIDRLSGALISDIELVGVGDIRSTIAYDAQSGRIFFTTADGYLCSACVDTASGVVSDVKMVYYNAKSTSTPVVYNGRVYFGTGSGITTSGSSGNFVAADAATLKMINYIGLRGYPQCSALLSTAHESEGYLYFYCTYNSKPGGISMIRVDAQSAMMELTELYDAAGYEQYCITSLICDKDGTIYYKNDSGNIMAVGFSGAAKVRRLYDALADTEKEKITNYSKLTEAEKTYAEIKAAISEVEKKIAAIGTVSAASGSLISDARAAYDALSASSRKNVSNYAVLQAAEERFRQFERAENVISLINAIGTVTSQSGTKITAARKAYDALSAEEKKLVTNYAVLQAAEAKFASLKSTSTPASTTKTVTSTTAKSTSSKTVTVEINGKKYTVDEKAAELMSRISALAERGNAQESEIVSLYRSYEALSETLKGQVYNYGDLEKMMVKLGEKNHVDALSGVLADGLAWNIKLTVEEVTGGTEYGYVLGSIGGNRLAKLLRIGFIDILTGAPADTAEPVRVKIPAEKSAGEIALALYRTADMTLTETRFAEKDGMLDFDAQSGLYAIVGITAAEKAEDTVKAESVTLPLTWIAAGGAGIAALLAVLIIELLKKKE